MWRELILGLCPEAELQPPAEGTQIAAAEAALGVSFPEELASLLRETNGVSDDYGMGVVWSCERIATNNIEFRSENGFADLYMPFDHLLFFGDHGNGDQFAYAILAGEIRNPFNIYIWDHEDDSRTCWAFWLTQYLQKALTGGDGEEDCDNI